MKTDIEDDPIYIREEKRLQELIELINNRFKNQLSVNADLLIEYNHLIKKFSKNIISDAANKYPGIEVEFLGGKLKTNYQDKRYAFVEGFRYFTQTADFKEIEAIIRCMVIEPNDERVSSQAQRMKDLIDSLQIYANPNL